MQSGNESGSTISIDAVCLPVSSSFAVMRKCGDTPARRLGQILLLLPQRHGDNYHTVSSGISSAAIGAVAIV